VSIDNALHDFPMQRHFHAEPRIQSADLLLQERIPHLVPLKTAPVDVAAHVPSVRAVTAAAVRRYATPHTLSPRPHFLSNGSYVVMVTNAGGGYSRRHDTAMTRWREDLTMDGWGSFCYIRDLDSGEVWSTTHQPTAREADEYEAVFAYDRAVFRRRDSGIETRTVAHAAPSEVDAVYVGWHPECGMRDIEAACNAIFAGAKLYVASDVPFFATRAGRTIGYSYAIVGAIRRVTRAPMILTGKPSLHALRFVAGRLKLKAREVAVVGDDPGVETIMANRLGATAFGVCTGVTSAQAWAKEKGLRRPKRALTRIAELLELAPLA